MDVFVDFYVVSSNTRDIWTTRLELRNIYITIRVIIIVLCGKFIAFANRIAEALTRKDRHCGTSTRRMYLSQPLCYPAGPEQMSLRSSESAWQSALHVGKASFRWQHHLSTSYEPCPSTMESKVHSSARIVILNIGMLKSRSRGC